MAEPYRVIKLRGLPFEANAMTIVEFLGGLVEETNIHFVSDRQGGTKPHSGEAFVDVLEGGEDRMREILQFNKKYMEHRYVEVIPSSVDEKRRFATRLISANGAEPDLGNVAPYEFTVNNGVMVRAECLIKGRGQPFNAKPSDIAEVFSDWMIEENRVIIEIQRDGRSKGNCFLLFENTEMRDECLEKCHRPTIGGRYIELFAGTEMDVADLERMQDFTHGAFAERSVILGEGENRFDDKDDRVLKLRGLPYRAAKADIIRFFEPSFNLIADQIQIVAGRDGRPAGECMVQMQNSEEAKDAKAKLDKKYMDERYVDVWHCAMGPANTSKGKGAWDWHSRDRDERRAGKGGSFESWGDDLIRKANVGGREDWSSGKGQWGGGWGASSYSHGEKGSDKGGKNFYSNPVKGKGGYDGGPRDSNFWDRKGRWDTAAKGGKDNKGGSKGGKFGGGKGGDNQLHGGGGKGGDNQLHGGGGPPGGNPNMIHQNPMSQMSNPFTSIPPPGASMVASSGGGEIESSDAGADLNAIMIQNQQLMMQLQAVEQQRLGLLQNANAAAGGEQQ